MPKLYVSADSASANISQHHISILILSGKGPRWHAIVMNPTTILDHTTLYTTSAVFGRPMSPPPPPLVYINGFPGVGKEAVAECLTLLLGHGKSVLINPRAISTETNPDPLTPEHPGYFRANSDSAPACNSTALSRLLSLPQNTPRIAVLALCAQDTPAGRSTIHTLESAASTAGRLFVPVSLTCEPAEHLHRANSLQRQCSLHKKTRPGLSPNKGTGGGGCKRPQLAAARGGATVDITRTPVLEAALQIVELVNRVVAERDAEMCGSAASTPTGVGDGWRKQLGC